MSGEFTQLLDLRKFPYDAHNIELLIASDHITTVCNLNINEKTASVAQVSRFTVRDQWYLTFDRNESVTALEPRRGAGGEYSQLSLQILCARNPTYHLLNTMLLMFLVVVLFFFSVFGVPRNDIAARMEVASNSVLTAVALKLLSAEQLPDLPHMTFLDKYMVASIFLQVGLVCFCWSLPRGDEDCVETEFRLACLIDFSRVDGILGVGGALVWIIVNVGLFKPLCCRTRGRRGVFRRSVSPLGESNVFRTTSVGHAFSDTSSFQSAAVGQLFAEGASPPVSATVQSI